MFSAVPRLSLAVSFGVFMLFAPLSVCLPRSPAAVRKAVRSRSHHHHPRADHNCGARSRTKDRLIKTERAREGERERETLHLRTTTGMQAAPQPPSVITSSPLSHSSHLHSNWLRRKLVSLLERPKGSLSSHLLIPVINNSFLVFDSPNPHSSQHPEIQKLIPGRFFSILFPFLFKCDQQGAGLISVSMLSFCVMPT